jgi:hypothetical protein
VDDLEGLLRQFQPRRPRPLPDAERARASRPLVWLALSGIAAAVVLTVSWREQPSEVEAPTRASLTLGALNAYTVRSLDDLDKVLTQMSPAVLPRVDQPGGVLYALAKE